MSSLKYIKSAIRQTYIVNPQKFKVLVVAIKMEFTGPVAFNLVIPPWKGGGIGPVVSPFLAASTATGKVSMAGSSTPFLPIKISEKQVYAFYCLDQTGVNPKYLYLTGNVDDGTVGLSADIGLAYSGAHWFIELCDGNKVKLICLGTGQRMALYGSAFFEEPKLCPANTEGLNTWELVPSSFQ